MVPTRKPITLAEAPSSVHSSELQDVSGWFGFAWQGCFNFCLAVQLVLVYCLTDLMVNF